MTFTVHLRDIIVPRDRARKTFTRIAEMAESIKKLGLIHPIVVAPADQEGKYILVAGERRYKGAILAGVAEVPATLREDDPLLLAEIEYEENVCRADISFEEEGECFTKILELRKQKDKSWSIEKTANLLNRSVGDVASKISINKKYKERPDLKAACEGMPLHAAEKKIKQIEEAEKVQRLRDQGSITLSTDLHHGDCLKLIKKVETASVTMLLTDPPYGLEKMEALRKPGSDKLIGHSLMSETHNLTLEEVKKLLKALAPEFHRVLKPGSHFYMFCGFQYVGDFIESLKPYLEFQPPLLVWDRGKPSSPGYGYNYLSKCEAIIYGHKPPRGRRLNEQKYNLIECPDVPRNLRRYPTEKPIPLLMTLIQQSSTHGDIVLDPFAGSASTLVAARKAGRKAIGFEIDHQAFLRSQQRLTEPESEETT